MKVRLVEIPVCDLCTRDGHVFQVTDVTGEFSSFTITRCDRHLDKLRQEGEAEGDINGGTPVVRHKPQPQRTPEESAAFRQELFELVANEPGRPPVYYSRQLGGSRQEVAYHLNHLVKEGRLATTGETSGKKVWVAGEVQATA